MRLVTTIAVLACCGCHRDSGGTGGAPAFTLEPVCKQEIARGEAAVQSHAPEQAPPEFVEHLHALVLECAYGQRRAGEVALEEITGLRDRAVPVLAEMAADKKRELAEIGAVLAALGAIDSPAAAAALARQVDPEKVRVAAIRQEAVLQLENESSDVVLPDLLAQLKYETDGLTVIGIAKVLAKHCNFAGVAGLRVLAGQPQNPQVQAEATAALAKIATTAKFADAEELWRAWCGPDREKRVPREEPSPQLRLAVWRRIASLAEFDLRIVDDARFALSHGSAWVVEPLTRALHDETPYVRVHAAQCLERMGPRAASACAVLVAALDEPHLASTSAAALAAIGCSDAAPALIARLGASHDAEMRNAAAAALGGLRATAAVAPLRALLVPAEARDLRQAAAQALLAIGDDAEAVRTLVDCLTTPGADAGTAEDALQQWLVRAAGGGDAHAQSLLAKWREFNGPPGEIVTAQDSTARQQRRAALLAEEVKHAPAR